MNVCKLLVVGSYFSIFYFAENQPSLLNETTVAVLECTEGFYQENSSNICTPSCYTWKQHNKVLSIFLDMMSLTSSLIAFLAAAAVIIISCLVHKRM